MKQVQPFHIDIPQSVLDNLQNKLKSTRWPDEQDGAGWNTGSNLAYMKELADYWQNKYDWRKQEAALNQLHHFKTAINGVNIHFIHEKGKGPNPKPILLSHGWPDSFYRFVKIIPMLTDPERFGGKAEDSFDVIIPSLPGFGFSDRVALTGEPIADMWATLMTDILGYDKFFASGGDMSTHILKALSAQHGDKLLGLHMTDVGYPNGSEDWSTMSPAEQEFGQFIQHWWFTEGAYNMLQSTKPQTISYALNDSPVGLAAWIIEKFYTWSACNNDLDEHFSKDELLTNIMIYWVTETIGSSMRMYMETARSVFMQPGGPKPAAKAETPTIVATYPGEAPVPQEWAERNVNLKRFTKMEKGGHFAAWEVPELYVKELVSGVQLLTANR